MKTKAKTGQRAKWVKIAGILAALLAAASLVVFLYCNAHNLYILGEWLGIHCNKTELEAVSLDVAAQRTLEELAADERIRFDQSAMLVNNQYPLPDDFEPELTLYKDTDVPMIACLVDAYADLSAAVTEITGDKLYVSSTYRTQEDGKLTLPTDFTAATISADNTGCYLVTVQE